MAESVEQLEQVSPQPHNFLVPPAYYTDHHHHEDLDFRACLLCPWKNVTKLECRDIQILWTQGLWLMCWTDTWVPLEKLYRHTLLSTEWELPLIVNYVIVAARTEHMYNKNIHSAEKKIMKLKSTNILFTNTL